MTVLVRADGTRQAVLGAKASPLAGAFRTTPPTSGYTSTVDLIGLGASKAYETVYREQVWVAVAVNKLARSIARLPLKSYRLDLDTGDRSQIRDHPVPVLLRSPWPRASAFDLKANIAGNLFLYGNALLAKWRPSRGAAPGELWPVPWRFVQPQYDDAGNVLAYVFQGANRRIVFLPDDVVHFRFWSPAGVGISPLEPLRRTLALEDAGQRYAISSFANAARPAGAFTTPNALRKEKREELETALAAIYAGPDNAFKTLLLDAGLSWQPFAHTSQEAETIEHRKLNREEVAAAFDIPPPMIGILDRATFSNIDEQHRMLYQDTLAPPLAMIEETFEAQLIDPELVYGGNVFVEFDLAGVLQLGLKDRAEGYTKMLSSGVRTPNELRRLENLPPVDGSADDPTHPANQVYVPVNLAPARVEEVVEGEVVDDDGDEEGALARLPAGAASRMLLAMLAGGGKGELEPRLRAIEAALLDVKYDQRPEPQAPHVEVDVAPPAVHVHFPDGFGKTDVTVEPPDVVVNPADVHVTVDGTKHTRKLVPVRGEDGQVVEYRVEEVE